MIKYCPLLAQKEAHLSYTEAGARYEKTWFTQCIKDKCAAYMPDLRCCNMFGRANDIELIENEGGDNNEAN